MIKKIYDKLKEIITENYLYFSFLFVFVAVFNYPLPYYIYNGGGLMDVDKKIEFNEKTESKGSYNLCYVSELKANVLTYVISKIKPDWELVKQEDVKVNSKETTEDIKIRDRIYLDSGNNNAIINAFNYANKEIELLNKRLIVMYIDENSKTDVEIGDEIVSIEKKEIDDFSELTKAVNSKNVGDKIELKVINKDKEYTRYAKIIKINDKKMIGIAVEEKYFLKTNPTINFNFNNNEAGPSGGLILTLALYDYLVDKDVTQGLKISGTGTIDKDGNVGEIGGVKYKLKGAVKKKADIFFVPNGENYEEAIKLKKKYNYKIDIVGVTTFEEAIKYLEKM